MPPVEKPSSADKPPDDVVQLPCNCSLVNGRLMLSLIPPCKGPHVDAVAEEVLDGVVSGLTPEFWAGYLGLLGLERGPDGVITLPAR